MTTKQILTLVIHALDEHKGQSIRQIDVRGKTSIADYLVIAGGTSERHVKALAEYVVEAAKKNHIRPLGVEGANVGEWVLVDLGDIIVHVMTARTRAHYQLEKLWEVDVAAASA